jgi:hypothetical protein
MPLHPGSRIICAANRPEHAPGGFELSAANANRVNHQDLAPSLDEVGLYFTHKIGDEGSALQAEARDWAATLNVESRLLEMHPPQSAVEAGATWGSPRAWEKGLRIMVEASAQGAPVDVQRMLLAGAVGDAPATTYIAVKELRKHLPAVDAIVKAPEKAPVPDNPAHQIAAIGLLTRVAGKDSHAAWLYCSRLRPEIGLAATRGLMTLPDSKGIKAKHVAKGRQAKIKQLAKAKRAIS